MDSYVQQLETQNEELKQKLSESQASLLKHEAFIGELTPRWSAVNGSTFYYGGYMSVVAVVAFDDGRNTWHYRFTKPSTDWDDTQGGPFKECYDAQQAVEKKYKSLLGMRACMMKILMREENDK